MKKNIIRVTLSFKLIRYCHFIQKKYKKYQCQFFKKLEKLRFGPILIYFDPKTSRKDFPKKSFRSTLRLHSAVTSCKKSKPHIGPTLVLFGPETVEDFFRLLHFFSKMTAQLRRKTQIDKQTIRLKTIHWTFTSWVPKSIAI